MIFYILSYNHIVTTMKYTCYFLHLNQNIPLNSTQNSTSSTNMTNLLKQTSHHKQNFKPTEIPILL